MVRVKSVYLDQDIKSKKELLAFVAEKMAEITSVDTHSIFERLFVREKLYTTAIGNKIAMPQANLPFVGEPFGIVVRLKNPVFFDEYAQIPVDTVYAFAGIEGQGSKNLMALSHATVAMRNPFVVKQIRNAKTEKAVMQAFADQEAVRVAA